jgi:predicted TIM-barrel fold metal-dependent hydrolase
VTFHFADSPVIDNHCHTLDPQKAILDPASLAREFYHGMKDLPQRGVHPRRWEASEELRQHLSNLGVVQTMIFQLSKLLGCATELDAVAAARNRHTAQSFSAYAKLLYEDAGIVGTVLDSGLPPDDPLLDLIPGKVMRLFQMSTAIQQLLQNATSYRELLHNFQNSLEHAVRQHGFIGVKAHVAEEVGFSVEPIAFTEDHFVAAKAGDAEAYKQLYLTIFTETLRQCQELRIPMHLHTGITGGLWNGAITNADPFRIVPLLRRPDFIQTRVVLLHGSYPWIQHAAMVAHALPHVWVDLSWTTPWSALRLVESWRDAISVMPLSKLMMGSGGHGTPEIAWLSAKTTKIALQRVLEDNVTLGLLDSKQAKQIGQMILHDNAARLYDLK